MIVLKIYFNDKNIVWYHLVFGCWYIILCFTDSSLVSHLHLFPGDRVLWIDSLYLCILIYRYNKEDYGGLRVFAAHKPPQARSWLMFSGFIFCIEQVYVWPSPYKQLPCINSLSLDVRLPLTKSIHICIRLWLHYFYCI